MKVILETAWALPDGSDTVDDSVIDVLAMLVGTDYDGYTFSPDGAVIVAEVWGNVPEDSTLSIQTAAGGTGYWSFCDDKVTCTRDSNVASAQAYVRGEPLVFTDFSSGAVWYVSTTGLSTSTSYLGMVRLTVLSGVMVPPTP